jgi:hypothetical protein
MGRVSAAAVLAATALAGCGSGLGALHASLPATATSTPTVLPGGPHKTMLVCPLRARRASVGATVTVLRPRAER